MNPEDMTDEQLRIAVAELCGWSGKGHGYDNSLRDNVFYGSHSIRGIKWARCPDYPADLNACSEFEKGMTKSQSSDYADALQDLLANHIVGYIVGNYIHDLFKLKCLICATARQRCIAFVKTMRKDAQ